MLIYSVTSGVSHSILKLLTYEKYLSRVVN